ncbi:hypothetical protein RJ639_026752 [Escallonia herrerae]|uniref:ATP-dependent DNA helicase RecQ zinc-binding domain-containing protein n=1 Tax=Escallonia herrerae TaxID=1293975 RepID=A0AA88X5M2_9ASTE|nr:hypothetical protein RJ639_026752 [Escallonia herrerae]
MTIIRAAALESNITHAPRNIAKESQNTQQHPEPRNENHIKEKLEFILSKAESNKLQSSSLKDGSKKSLADFDLVVKYCECLHCRRKKILESFGEQVPVSLCNKSCDTCKHPDLVAKYLEELRIACTFRHRNGSSRIYISGSSNLIDQEQFSEFWNRDDEASGSEEDISDADDGIDAVKNLVRSRLPLKSRLNDKIELLQRAEENYYQNKNPDKVNFSLPGQPIDKKAISETLRETSKQRLLNAIKQSEQRLSDLRLDFETSACFLENECYKRYGKAGKSFYISQVASTLRWLSTANSLEIANRLCNPSNSTSLNISPEEKSSPASPSCDPVSTEIRSDENHASVRPETPSIAVQTTTQVTELPQIPSFSEFINRKNAHSPDNVQKNQEKRLKFH